jgi:hypothetical protein
MYFFWRVILRIFSIIQAGSADGGHRNPEEIRKWSSSLTCVHCNRVDYDVFRQ